MVTYSECASCRSEKGGKVIRRLPDNTDVDTAGAGCNSCLAELLLGIIHACGIFENYYTYTLSAAQATHPINPHGHPNRYDRTGAVFSDVFAAAGLLKEEDEVHGQNRPGPRTLRLCGGARSSGRWLTLLSHSNFLVS